MYRHTDTVVSFGIPLYSIVAVLTTKKPFTVTGIFVPLSTQRFSNFPGWENYSIISNM